MLDLFAPLLEILKSAWNFIYTQFSGLSLSAPLKLSLAALGMTLVLFIVSQGLLHLLQDTLTILQWAVKLFRILLKVVGVIVLIVISLVIAQFLLNTNRSCSTLEERFNLVVLCKPNIPAPPPTPPPPVTEPPKKLEAPKKPASTKKPEPPKKTK